MSFESKTSQGARCISVTNQCSFEVLAVSFFTNQVAIKLEGI
jgi:hypothetical protein